MLRASERATGAIHITGSAGGVGAGTGGRDPRAPSTIAETEIGPGLTHTDVMWFSTRRPFMFFCQNTKQIVVCIGWVGIWHWDF